MSCDFLSISKDVTIHGDDEAHHKTLVTSQPEKFRLIERMADTIHKMKLKHDKGAWIECGKKIKSKTVSTERSWIYAWSIVEASESISDEEFTLIPWSLAAIYANESWFDRCAMGPGPREWAYKRHRRGLSPSLKKKRNMLSHSEKQILSIITSKEAKRAFSFSGYDLGPCQLLTRFWEGNPFDMMTVYYGSYICAREARKRCVRYKVAQPQLFWPGRKSRWYQSRVNQRLRRNGISIKEQFDTELYYKTSKI
jgi:hypothetical protein